MQRSTGILLATALILVLPGCHARREQVATAPTAQQEAQCANVVAPSRGDADYNQMKLPIVSTNRVPLIGTGDPVHAVSADVRVNATGRVDSVVLLNSMAAINEGMARRLLSAKAQPARYHGCPVTAWTIVELSK